MVYSKVEQFLLERGVKNLDLQCIVIFSPMTVVPVFASCDGPLFTFLSYCTMVKPSIFRADKFCRVEVLRLVNDDISPTTSRG